MWIQKKERKSSPVTVKSSHNYKEKEVYWHKRSKRSVLAIRKECYLLLIKE